MKLSLTICFSSAGAARGYQMLAVGQDVPLRSKLSLPDDYAAPLPACRQALVCLGIRSASLLAPPGR
jgi:hypothetical protein